MYKGKHTRASKAHAKRKASVLLSALVLISILAAGTTVAFLKTTSGTVTNTFSPSQVSRQVIEDSFNYTEKTGVKVKNTGNTEAYIRAAIVITWKNNENGNVYGQAPGTDDYTMTLGPDWTHGEDGYYYYMTPVAPNESTPVLISNCTAVQDNIPVGYGLNVEIIASAVQSKPTHVVNSVWASSGLTFN